MSNVAEVRAASTRRLIIAVVCVLLISFCLAALAFLTRSPDNSRPIDVTDAERVVTLNLPAGWVENTAGDAGRISTEGDSGDTVLAYRVPDISAYQDPEDGDSLAGSWLHVTIGIPLRGTPHLQQHQMLVKSTNEDLEMTWSSPKPIADISGHPAIRSSAKSSDPSSDLVVITVLTDDYFIAFEGSTTLPREPGWDNLPSDPRREELPRLVAKARIG